MRKCRICGDKFKPSYNTLQATCGKMSCAIAHGKKTQEKTRKKESAQRKREYRENDLSWWLQVGGPEVTTNGGNAGYWLHRWVRLVRDKDQPCIMCGSMTPKGGHWDACHWRARGAAKQLRFEPDNIHKGCAHCNTRTSGDTGALYRTNLVLRIGEDRTKELENDNRIHRWTIDECREIRDRYRKLVKEHEKDAR